MGNRDELNGKIKTPKASLFERPWRAGAREITP
jgi:hypothetical protein